VKAAVLHKIDDLRVEEVPTPEIKEGWALIKVDSVGICGSDIPRVKKTGTYSFPLIPGHEFSGKVLETGEKVAVYPLIPCGKCPFCKIGLPNLCDHYDYLGSRRDGGFAQFVSVPKGNLIPVPENVSLEDAALTEPASVAQHAVKKSKLVKGGTVLVIGAGTIGYFAAQWAYVFGARKVIVIDIDTKKLEIISKTIPAEVFISDASIIDKILSFTDGIGVDVSIEAVGSSKTIEVCFLATRKGGEIINIGNPESDITISSKSFAKLNRGELTITGSWNSIISPSFKNEWRVTLENMSAGRINAKNIITHRFPLERINEAIDLMYLHKESYGKVVINL
jgi:L-iditol 2-dehydrogenase